MSCNIMQHTILCHVWLGPHPSHGGLCHGEPHLIGQPVVVVIVAVGVPHLPPGGISPHAPPTVEGCLFAVNVPAPPYTSSSPGCTRVVTVPQVQVRAKQHNNFKLFFENVSFPSNSASPRPLAPPKSPQAIFPLKIAVFGSSGPCWGCT